MGYYIHFLVISFGWNLLCCDATVAVSLINSAKRAGTLECGSDGIVNCRTDPNTDLISWIIDGTIYATCLPDCSENPNIIRNYTAMYDKTKGDLNLTIASVTFNDSNTTFKCDDGSSFDSITIEVVPAYSENKTSINAIDEGKQVEFTTACVQPGVEFEWFTIKTNSSDRKRYKRGQANTTHTLSCSNEVDCGGGGTGKVSSVIIIPTVLNGTESDIEVIVKYKNPDEERTFRFDEVFLIEDESTDNDGGLSTVIVVVITIVPIVIVIACVTCICIWIKKRESKMVKKSPQWLCDLCRQPRTESKSENKCKYCREFICKECTQTHTKKHTTSIRELEEKKNNTINNKPTWWCDSCNQPQIKSKSENQCFCNMCTQNHFKTHNSISTNYQQRPRDLFLNVSQAWTDKNRITDDCLCSQNKNNSKSYCLACQRYLCKLCIKNHAGHNILTRYEHDKNRNTDILSCPRSRDNAESYCLTCKQYLCKWCVTNHATHITLGHCHHEAWETRCPISCSLCEKNNVIKKAKYYRSSVKSFVCEDCKSQKGFMDIIAVDDYYFHSENNVDSYCLSCQQYLCSLCFTKHAEHRILRHSQQETKLDESHRTNIIDETAYKPERRNRNAHGAILQPNLHGKTVEIITLEIPQVKYTKAGADKARCQIFCKYCQNMSIKADAKYYSKSEKSFFCNDCRPPEKGIEDSIAIDDPEMQCKRCEDNNDDIINPDECYCMRYNENMCAVCFEKIREQSVQLHPIQTDLCELHSVAGLPVKTNDVIDSTADVLCLVCNEYLCTMCFKQHLDLKQLWRKQHTVDKKLNNQTRRKLKRRKFVRM